jgi:hypothetical protein
MNKSVILSIMLIYSSSAISRTGTILPEKAAVIPSDQRIRSDDSRKILNDYAACTIDESRKRVEEFLAMAPGSAEAEQLLLKVAINSCLLNGSMTLNSSAYRAAAYDVLYHLDFKKHAPLDFSSVTPIEYVQRGKGMTAEDAAGQSVLRKLADCAVRHGPSDARQLVLAPIGSVAETSALGPLTPHLSACMTNDVTLKFSKFTLKGYIGEALYRLSIAARSAVKSR